MGDVVLLDTVTLLDIPADRIIEGAKDLKDVVIVGWDADGEFYFASNLADGGDVLWLLEKAKKDLLETEE